MRRVRAERLGLGTHRGDRGIDRRFRRGDIVVVEEPGAGGRRQAETRGVEVHAGDAQRAGAILVEENFQRVAGKQVDAVVRGIAGELVDLRQDVVVVALQRGTRGRNRCDGIADRGAGGDAECSRLRIRRDGESGGVGVAGQHQMAAAVVACGHRAIGAEAGDGVDRGFDRGQRFARRDRDRVAVGADIDQQVATACVQVVSATVPVVAAAAVGVVCCACSAVDSACSSRLVRPVRPLLAASSVCWPWPI